MGHAIGDWNNDGLMDWFSTAIIDEKATCATVGCTFDDGGNKLYQNRGGRQFDDVTQQVDCMVFWTKYISCMAQMENNFLSKFWSPRSTELLTVEEFFADENFEQKIYIHYADLIGSNCEKCNYRSSGRNCTCGPAIPVQPSNQLSHKSSSNHKFLYIYGPQVRFLPDVL